MAAILSTSFAAPVTDWAAQWSLASVTGVQIGHLCAAESELAQVTKVGPGTTVTVRRGVEATSAASHATSTPVAVYQAGDVRTGEAPPPSPAAGSLRQVTVVLTDPQIKALPSGGIELLGRPGPTRLYVPVLASLCAETEGGAYTNLNLTLATITIGSLDMGATFLRTVVNSTDTTPDLTRLSALLGTALRKTVVLDSALGFSPLTALGFVEFGGLVDFTENFLNERLVIYGFNNSTGDWTGGHAANTLRVSVLYSILDVTTGLFV